MIFRIYDDFTTPEKQEMVANAFKEIIELPYHYGEQDNPDTPPTGMVANLPEDSYILKTLKEFYENSSFEHRQHYPHLNRSYVNLFAPRELPYYHTDGNNCMTLLYYANPIWNWNEGGETKIINAIDKNVQAIVPIPGRIVIFDGRLQHTATSFRNMQRFTVALKFKSENN